MQAVQKQRQMEGSLAGRVMVQVVSKKSRGPQLVYFLLKLDGNGAG